MKSKNDLMITNLNLYDNDAFFAIYFKAGWLANFNKSIKSILWMYGQLNKNKYPNGNFVASYCRRIYAVIESNHEVDSLNMIPISPSTSDACEIEYTYKATINAPMLFLFNRFMFGMIKELESNGLDKSIDGIEVITTLVTQCFSQVQKKPTVFADIIEWFGLPMSNDVFDLSYSKTFKEIEKLVVSGYLNELDDDERIYCLPSVMKKISEQISK